MTNDLATPSKSELGPESKAGSSSESGSELRALLRLAWPMMATQFFIMATGFIDTVMAGRSSALDLAGVTLGGNIMWPAFMLLTGITMALTPIVSQLQGSGNLADAGGRIRQALWFALASSVVMVMICLNAEPMYAAMGISGPGVTIATGYLRAAAWGLPAVIFYVALRQVCEGLGQVRLPMWIAASVVPLNALLNYIFIYGKFGFPAMGGVGCGWATAIVFWVELLLMLVVVKQPFFQVTKTFTHWSWPQLRPLLRLLQLGLPIGLAIFLEMAVFSVMGLAIARIGVVELAANSVAGSLNWLTYVLPAGLGAAASIRVGYYVGAAQLTNARNVAGIAFRVSLVYGVIMSLLLVILRSSLVMLYTNDVEVMQLAAQLILFVALYQIFDDTNAVAVGALRGYKDTQVPMLYGLIGFWLVAIPLGTLLAFGMPKTIFGSPVTTQWQFDPIGVYGYWLALTLGLFIVAIMVSVRLFRTSRDEVRINQLAGG